MTAVRRSYAFWIGLALIAAYWLWMKPPPGGRVGFFEDYCWDIQRQVMADTLASAGRPAFFSDRVMAPQGASTAYFSWAIERDWLGAYAWKLLGRDFPFYWALFGASLLAIYAGVGLCLRRLAFGPVAAWVVACGLTLLNIPRHYKASWHLEHTLLHWSYLGFFVDAVLWSRLWRERRYSVELEAWRVTLLAAMMLGTGTHWGPMLLEWLIVRASILAAVVARGKPEVEWHPRRLIAPAAVSVALGLLELRWFVPLAEEAKRLGEIYQPVGWFAEGWRVFFTPAWPGFGPGETIVTPGWSYWLPVLAGLWFIRRRKGGPGVALFAPFVAYFAIAWLYLQEWTSPGFQGAVQAVVPFMKFFRVGSRFGLFLPVVLGALAALGWPELRRGIARPRAALAVFALLFAFEAAAIFRQPLEPMPPMSAEARELLEKVRRMPGDQALDVPFCVAGGNGYCTVAQCPNYPFSTVGQCLRGWHDKAIYGVYLGRTTPEHCRNYAVKPYTDWFGAWRQQRCFTKEELDGLCWQLAAQPIASVIVYPEIWKAADRPECRAELERRLGPPVGEANLLERPFTSEHVRNWDPYSGPGYWFKFRVYEGRCRN